MGKWGRRGSICHLALLENFSQSEISSGLAGTPGDTSRVPPNLPCKEPHGGREHSDAAKWEKETSLENGGYKKKALVGAVFSTVVVFSPPAKDTMFCFCTFCSQLSFFKIQWADSAFVSSHQHNENQRHMISLTIAFNNCSLELRSSQNLLKNLDLKELKVITAAVVINKLTELKGAKTENK